MNLRKSMRIILGRACEFAGAALVSYAVPFIGDWVRSRCMKRLKVE